MFPNKWFNITVVQVYCPTTDVEEAEVDQFYEDLKQVIELTPKKKKKKKEKTKKRCPFHCRGLECNSRKSMDTEDNRQVWPCNTK